MPSEEKAGLTDIRNGVLMPIVSEIESQNPPPLSKPETRTPDYALLARMVIREGKSFKESALAAGYSVSVAARGLKALATDSKPVADAVKRENEAFSISLDKLKPLAVNRLHAEITNPKSPNGMKAIELAGRFKETDWFVRNTDVQIGVFAALADPGSQAPIDVAIESLPESSE